MLLNSPPDTWLLLCGRRGSLHFRLRRKPCHPLQLYLCLGGATRLAAFSPSAKINVLPPSSWRQARVHRTLAFYCSSHRRPTKKKDQPLGWSFLWSGRRGSNSLPPPWQGGALPDELRPQRTRRIIAEVRDLSSPFYKIIRHFFRPSWELFLRQISHHFHKPSSPTHSPVSARLSGAGTVRPHCSAANPRGSTHRLPG